MTTEERAKYNKEYREKNPELFAEYLRVWRAANPGRQKEINTRSVKSNPERTRRVRQRWLKLPTRCSLNYRISECLRHRSRKALKGISKSAKTLELLGCSVENLREHLERQFRPGMAWSNHGPVWHIDHIRPCANFDLTVFEQQKQCFHYTNLQPLFAAENIKKGDTYG